MKKINALFNNVKQAEQYMHAQEKFACIVGALCAQLDMLPNMRRKPTADKCMVGLNYHEDHPDKDSIFIEVDFRKQLVNVNVYDPSFELFGKKANSIIDICNFYEYEHVFGGPEEKEEPLANVILADGGQSIN